MTNALKQLFEDQTKLAKATEWKKGGLVRTITSSDVQDGDIQLASCPDTGLRVLLYGTKHGVIAVFENTSQEDMYVLGVMGAEAYNEVECLGTDLTLETFNMIIDGSIVNHPQVITEEETMSDKTETTAENKTTGKVKGYAKKFGKGVLYGAGAVALAGGAYALYAILKGTGADAAAEAVGEAAGAAVSAAGEAVAETVAAWK